MPKKQRIRENKKIDKRKTKVISIRTDESTKKIITEKAAFVGVPPSEYIITSCLKSTIQVIPEGKKLLEGIHDVKKIIRELPQTPTAKEADAALSAVICRIHTALS